MTTRRSQLAEPAPTPLLARRPPSLGEPDCLCPRNFASGSLTQGRGGRRLRLMPRNSGTICISSLLQGSIDGVESVHVLSDKVVRRRISIDFTLPEAVIDNGETLCPNEQRDFLIPIALLEEDPLVDLDVVDSSSNSRSTRRELQDRTPSSKGLHSRLARLAAPRDTTGYALQLLEQCLNYR